MGLRTKLIIVLLLVFGALELVIITIFQSRTSENYATIEFEAAQADMVRAVDAIEHSVKQIDDALLEWALWTELYEFMNSGSTKFRASYFSHEGITQARYVWLGVYDVKGQLFASVGHDIERSVPLALPELADATSPLGRQLGRPVDKGAADCGLLRLEGRLYAMCRRAILNSFGKGPSRGVVVMLKTVDANFMARVTQQTRLEMQLGAPVPVAPCRLCTSPIRSDIGSGPAQVLRSRETYTFEWALQDVLGQRVGTLSLNWPRTIAEQGRRSINESAILFALLIGCGALLMLKVIDRLVVHRVTGLASALHAICAGKDWTLRTRDGQRDEIGELSARANDLLALIEQQMSELKEHSSTDALTGLPNRRCFNERFPKLMRQHQRSGQPLTLVAVDVDCFKDYNDAYGHVRGDEALRIVADCLRQSAQRAVDMPVRIGGEEFLLVLPDCTSAGAHAVAERFRQSLRERRIPHAHSQAGPWLSASLGVSSMRAGDNLEDFVTRADMAMYRAKALGRDRVEMDEAPGGTTDERFT